MEVVLALLDVVVRVMAAERFEVAGAMSMAAMRERKLMGRVLISQDAGWFHVGEPGGGKFRPFTYLFTDFVPKLEAGEAEQLLAKNPRRAFGN